MNAQSIDPQPAEQQPLQLPGKNIREPRSKTYDIWPGATRIVANKNGEIIWEDRWMK